jgi:hypothetical protein
VAHDEAAMKRWLALALWTACQPPAATVGDSRARPVVGAIDTDALLEAAVHAAKGAGATDYVPLGSQVMFEGEQLGSFVAIPRGQCLLSLARGGKGIGDIDMFVYDDLGNRLAADEAPVASAATLVCPPHPRRAYVTARVMDGDGPVALAIMTVAVDKADAVAAAIEVRGRPGQDTGRFSTWPGLERTIRERRASLGGRWRDIRRTALFVDSLSASAMTFDVPARRCVDVLVAPSAEVAGVDASLVDTKGRVIARARSVEDNRAFLLCSATEEKATVMVRAQRSRGLVVVVVGRSALGAASDLAERGDLSGPSPFEPLDRAVARQHARLEALTFRSQSHVGDGVAKVGVQTAIDLSLGQGCSRIDVVGGTPLGRFSASLWSVDGRRRAEQSGGDVVTMFACGAAGPHRLEIRADVSGGPFAVHVASEVDAPAALSRHPTAASHLLSRLDAARGPIAATSAKGAIALTLAVDQRISHPLAASSDKCVDVVVAAEPPAAGLTLYLRTGSQTELRASGERVVSDRICDVADGARLELEAAVAGPALVLTR